MALYGLRLPGCPADESQCDQRCRDQNSQTQSRDLVLREWYDFLACRRCEDKAADNEQDAERPFQRACAAQVPNESLITLDASADEERSTSGQCRQTGGVIDDSVPQ